MFDNTKSACARKHMFHAASGAVQIEEIGLKCKLLKYIGKMKHFWPVGAETIIFVTF